MSRRICFYLGLPIFLAAALALAQILRADSVYLKDGYLVEGEILEETDDSVTVRQVFRKGGSLISTYKRSEIERIEKSSEETSMFTEKEHVPDGLDVTYEAMMWNLEIYFKRMKPSSQIDGKPRCVGETRSGHAVLEVIGEKENIAKVNLALSRPQGYQDALEIKEIIRIFCENAVPEWAGCGEWVEAAMRKRQKESTVKGTKKILVVYRADLDITIITVKRSDER
jgi:hypothetical protein